MATFANQTKNVSPIVNVAPGGQSLTWDEATFAWQDAGEATWDNPTKTYVNQTKNASVIANQTKN